MNNPLYTEADFAALVQANKATIILLSDPNYPNDMTIARYVVVSGVNTTSHQLKIIDPIPDNQIGLLRLIMNVLFAGSKKNTAQYKSVCRYIFIAILQSIKLIMIDNPLIGYLIHVLCYE
jgi:hypothetical protein